MRERLLERQLKRLEPSVRREVERALVRLRRRASGAALVQAVLAGDDFKLRSALARLARDLEPAAAVLLRAVDAGAASGARALIGARLDLTNSAAVLAARQRAARFVTAVSTETRKAIRGVVTRAFTDGLSPAETAKLVRPLIGLTERQALAVVNRRAKRVRQGWEAARVSADARRYAAQLLRRRATTIARTEIIQASNDGQLAAWQDARQQGLLPATAKRRWIVTPDDRLCPICAPLSGQTAALDGVFETSVGAKAGPPAHPNCRCTTAIDVRSVRVRQAA